MSIAHRHFRAWWCVGTTVLALFLFISYMAKSISQARSSARALNGHCHASIIALAVHNYASSSTGHLPLAAAGQPPHSWRIKLLNFLDQADLRRAYRPEVAWDVEPNAALSREYLKICQVPHPLDSKRDASGRYFTDFGLITGPGTAFPAGGAVTLTEIINADGLGQTLIFGECSGLRIVWTEPRDPDVSREQIGIEVLSKPGQTSNRLLSGYMPDGVITAFQDCSARVLSKKIDLKVLKALCTFDGNETINQSDYLR